MTPLGQAHTKGNKTISWERHRAGTTLLFA